MSRNNVEQLKDILNKIPDNLLHTLFIQHSIVIETLNYKIRIVLDNENGECELQEPKEAGEYQTLEKFMDDVKKDFEKTNKT